MTDIQDALLKMKVLIPKKHVILMSHMRANTSVISHLIGSHEDISGYYEMHIGYYSWKSFINQKLKFHEQNTDEPMAKVYFDKVLHSEHFVNGALFDGKNNKLIVSLREPIATINSVVKLYKKNNPNHPCSEVQHAAEYYRDRVLDIEAFAKNLPVEHDFYYYDADDIIDKTELTLSQIQQFIGLDTPFATTYRKFDKTGERFSGDSSKNIQAGKVLKKAGDQTPLDIDDALLQQCQDAYIRCRILLKNRSWVGDDIPTATPVS